MAGLGAGGAGLGGHRPGAAAARGGGSAPGGSEWLPLAPRGPALCCGDHCVTCSDEGVAMRVLAVADEGLARCVDEQGRESEVLTGIVACVVPGDVLLVHAGAALLRLVAAEEVGA